MVTHDDNYTTWIRHSKVQKKKNNFNKIPCPGPVIVPWHLHSHSRAIAATPIDWHFQTGCLRLRSVSVWFENFRRCNNGCDVDGPGTWTAYPDVAQVVCSSMPPFCRHVSWNRSYCRRTKKSTPNYSKIEINFDDLFCVQQSNRWHTRQHKTPSRDI